MLPIIRVLRGITRHPLNRDRPFEAIRRFAAWQIGTRLLKSPVAVPFAGDTRLLVHRGMTGASGNIYCGLHEYEDMAFVLHVLRPDDLFVDVGANIGSYTILAGGVTGARCVSLEPVPVTFSALVDNLRLNGLVGRVDYRNIAAGGASGFLDFTSDLDTVNHALADGESATRVTRVAVEPLDAVLAETSPTVIKIDVEGFETSVVDGAERILRSPSLLAVLMELNGSGSRYGYDERALHDRMLSLDFVAAVYDPAARSLRQLDPNREHGGNTLYVRDWDTVRARLSAAPRVKVRDFTI